MSWSGKTRGRGMPRVVSDREEEEEVVVEVVVVVMIVGASGRTS